MRETAQITFRQRGTYLAVFFQNLQVLDLFEEKRNFTKTFQKHLGQKTRQPSVKYLQITLEPNELQQKYIYYC